MAGLDSDFKVNLEESLHLQSDARLAVYKIRLADSFLSTDRGRYLCWVDAALGTLNLALLPQRQPADPHRPGLAFYTSTLAPVLTGHTRTASPLA